MTCSAVSWYVVHTKPHKEMLATSMLEDRLRLAVFLPQVLQRYRGRMVPRPFFPRYLFVHLDLTQVEPSAIDAIPGVTRLVRFDDQPQPVRDEIVASIREEVERINAEGGLPEQRFQPGALVRLKRGPFQGQVVRLLRHLSPADRVAVLLELLGRENEVVVNVEDIEPVRPPRRRGTRGKGRRIRYAGAS